MFLAGQPPGAGMHPGMRGPPGVPPGMAMGGGMPMHQVQNQQMQIQLHNQMMQQQQQQQQQQQMQLQMQQQRQQMQQQHPAYGHMQQMQQQQQQQQMRQQQMQMQMMIGPPPPKQQQQQQQQQIGMAGAPRQQFQGPVQGQGQAGMHQGGGRGRRTSVVMDTVPRPILDRQNSVQVITDQLFVENLPHAHGHQLPTHQQVPTTKSMQLNPDIIKYYSVPKEERNSDTFRPLTPTDEYYFDNPHAPQRVYMRFKHLLDPLSLTQALDLTFEECPIASSKVCKFQGGRSFHCNCEVAQLPVILVDEEVFDNYLSIAFICERMSEGTPPDVPLSMFFMFRTPDPANGCILVAHFHHVIGDATCYSRFLMAWSKQYKSILDMPGYVPHPVDKMPRAICTEADLKRQVPRPNQTENGIAMRWFFDDSEAKRLKASVLGDGPNDEHVSTNDILLAQAACALGPCRRHELQGGKFNKDYAYIALLADHRGHGLPESTWGNGATDLSIFLPWSMLCAGDVRAAALLIRKQIKDEFHLLEHNIDAFNDRRFESATNKRLFCWNSWHKAGSSMCTADFGEDMLEFEWLNLFNHIDTDTVLVNAATAKFGLDSLGEKKKAYLGIQIGLKDDNEKHRLQAMWGPTNAFLVPGVGVPSPKKRQPPWQSPGHYANEGVQI